MTKEWEEIAEVEQYIKARLEDAGVDLADQPEDAYDVIAKSCDDYLLTRDPDVITDSDYHYIMIVRIAHQINNSVARYREKGGETLSKFEGYPVSKPSVKSFADRRGRYSIGNTMTLIYSMSYELIDDLMEEILKQQVADSTPESGKNAIASQIGNYRGKANTLRACDALTAEQQKVIEHVGDVRSALVHDVEQRFTLSVIGDLNTVNWLPHVLDDLYQMVYDKPAYYHFRGDTRDDLPEL